jgi:hypothetical protein
MKALPTKQAKQATHLLTPHSRYHTKSQLELTPKKTHSSIQKKKFQVKTLPLPKKAKKSQKLIFI